MNQNSMEIRLRNYMASDDGWGNDQGRDVFAKLLRIVESNHTKWIFRISLDGVKRTDASFPRESVVELAKKFRGQKGFCLVNVANQDLLDNWDAAALKREQPLTVWNSDAWKLIGPQPSKGSQEVLNYAMSVSEITAAVTAAQFDLKLTNASNKLKQLAEGGYLLRKEELAPSGGIEFFYFRIK